MNKKKLIYMLQILAIVSIAEKNNCSDSESINNGTTDSLPICWSIKSFKTKDELLYGAVVNDNPELILELIDKGANINQLCTQGESLLHTAAVLSKRQAIEALVSRGLSVNARRSFLFDTPLDIAAKKFDVQTMQLLVDLGAHIDHESNVILNKVLSVKLFHDTTLKMKDTIDFLLANNVNQSIQDDKGRNVLMNAILHKAPIEIIQTLLAHHTSSINQTDLNSNNALHYAMAYNCIETAKLLVDKGIKVDQFNNDAILPLDYGQTDAVRVIQEYIENQAIGSKNA